LAAGQPGGRVSQCTGPAGETGRAGDCLRPVGPATAVAYCTILRLRAQGRGYRRRANRAPWPSAIGQ